MLPVMQEVFDKIDEDDSGYLDRVEVEKGAGMLGASLGFLMSEEMLSAAWKAMAPEGDLVGFDVFENWWRGVEGGQLTVTGSVSQDARSLARELAEARRQIAAMQGPAATRSDDYAALQEKQQDVEATARLRDAGNALLFSAGGLELAKYTSKTPPAREVRFFCFTKKRDIMWAKKAGGNGTVVKPRKGDVQSVHHGMALTGRADDDIAQDSGWRSFHLLGQGRCFQFTVADEETFLQVYLAVHELLRQIALTLPDVENPPELNAAHLRNMVSLYKDKDTVSAPAGYIVAVGARNTGAEALASLLSLSVDTLLAFLLIRRSLTICGISDQVVYCTFRHVENGRGKPFQYASANAARGGDAT